MLAACHPIAPSRPLCLAQNREFAQRRRDYRALYAGGEERAQRSDGEEMPWRPQRTMMKENPEQPTRCGRNRGGGHLRPEEKSRLTAAGARQCECRAGPEHAGENVQREDNDEGRPHGIRPSLGSTIRYTSCISNYGIRVTRAYN